MSMDVSNTHSFAMFLSAILQVKQMQKSHLLGKNIALLVRDQITALKQHLKRSITTKEI